MTFGLRLLQWRRFKKISQQKLADQAGVTRPYISRLEQNAVDPSLSAIRHLAAALELSAGDLIDRSPDLPSLSRIELDHLAQAAIHPSKALIGSSQSKRLTRALQPWRQATRKTSIKKGEKNKEVRSNGRFALRKLRADLGESQYHALIKKIQKHEYSL